MRTLPVCFSLVQGLGPGWFLDLFWGANKGVVFQEQPVFTEREKILPLNILRAGNYTVESETHASQRRRNNIFTGAHQLHDPFSVEYLLLQKWPWLAQSQFFCSSCSPPWETDCRAKSTVVWKQDTSQRLRVGLQITPRALANSAVSFWWCTMQLHELV